MEKKGTYSFLEKKEYCVQTFDLQPKTKWKKDKDKLRM